MAQTTSSLNAMILPLKTCLVEASVKDNVEIISKLTIEFQT